METQLRALARHAFRFKVYSFQGQAYENLFVEVMQHKNRQFRPVKPQGRFGDRKNDGFDPHRGQYYQVFAPEDLRKNPSAAIRKVREDFAGLKVAWKGIQEFFFVINDKYRGAYPEIESTLNEIKQQHKLKVCKPFLAQDLEATLFSLPDDVIASVTGLILSGTGINLKYEFGGKLQEIPATSFIANEALPRAVRKKNVIDQQRHYLHDKLSKLAGAQLAQQILLQVNDADKALLALVGTGNILSRSEYLERLFTNVSWKPFVTRMRKRGCILQNSGFIDLAGNVEEALFHDKLYARSSHESWISVLLPNSHYWDLALALCIHLVAVSDWKRLIEHAHNMIFSVEENWVSRMFFDVLSRIDTPKILKKLSSEDKVFLFDAIGTYQIHQNNNTDALESFRKMLRIARSTHNSWGIRQAFLHIGIAWLNIGNLHKAELSYRKAEAGARTHRDYFLLGRVLNNLFYCLKERDATLAARVIKESIKIKRRHRDRMGLGASYTALGIQAADTNRYGESVMWFRRTERIAHRFGELYAEAQSLHNQSNSLLALKRYEDAIACEQRAYKIAKGLERPDLLELAVVGLALALYRGGRKKAALTMFLEAYDIKIARGDISGAVTALSDAGATALHFRDHLTAIKYFRRAIQVGLKNRVYNSIEIPILNLASVWTEQKKRHQAFMLLTNHVDRLESMRQWEIVVPLLRRMIVMREGNQSDQKQVNALWTRALMGAEKSGNIKLQIDLLKQRCSFFRDRGDAFGALKTIISLVQLLRRRPEFLVEYLETLTEFANEVQKLGDYNSAESIYRSILGVAKRTKFNRLCSISLTNLGEVLRRTERPIKAIPLYRQAIKMAEIDGDDEGRLVTEHNLALALQAIDKIASANILLGKVLDKSRRRMDWKSHGNAWLALGDIALSGGKYYLARNRYQKAKDVGLIHGVMHLVQEARDREHQLNTALR
jgi:tetratricopeptide (TPR) repeat protein